MLSRRARIALLIAGVCLAFGGAIVFGALTANDTASVQGGVTFHAPDGPAVNLTGQTDVDTTTLYPDANTVELNTTSGNITFTSNGRTNATIDESAIAAPTTTVSELDVQTNDLTINPEDKPALTVGGPIDSAEVYPTPAIGDTTDDASYSAGASGGTITIRGLAPNEPVYTYVGGDIRSTNTTGQGAATFTNLPSGTNDVRIQSSSPPTATFLNFETTRRNWIRVPTTADISASDPDGQDVTVTVDLDGSEIYNQTGPSITYAVDPPSSTTSGVHTLTLTATDSNGLTTTKTAEIYVSSPPSVSNVGPSGDVASATQISADVSDPDFQNGETVEIQWGLDGQQIATTTADSNGTYTKSIETLGRSVTLGQHAVTVSAIDQAGNSVSSSSSFDLHDGPTLSNPSPTGQLQSAPGQLAVNVSDPNFDASGDSVTVEFYVDGSSVGTTTVSSAGTATVSHTPTAGEHTWNATATDDAGLTTELNPQTFSVPDELQIRNESDPSQLVSANVALTFFSTGSGQVIQRNTSSGTIDMSGLPVESFYVAVEADGYQDRTVYIDSLYVQQNVFVLPENATSVSTRFVLEDFTGEYPEQSRLTISRALNVSGSNEYRAVTTDQFGTEGVTATLEQGIRYRVSITAPDGRTQDLGPYRATTSETVTIQPGTGELAGETYAPGVTSDASLDNRTLSVSYADADGETDSVTVAVFERGSDPRHYLAANATYTNLGNLSTQYTLTANESETQWVVLLDVERGDESFTIRHVVSNQPDATPASLDPFWRTVFAVLALYIFGGIFSVLNRAVGALSVGIVGGLLWWTGWLAGATAGVAVVIYLFVAVAYTIYQGQRVG